MINILTKELVHYILKTSYEDIPENVFKHAKKSLLNWLGVTVGAINHETIDIILGVTIDLSVTPQSTILGRKQKVDLLSAVLINGTSSHIFDYDDTHLDTIHHPSGPVAPVVFALGEKYDFAPKELLRAFILGCEVELRISNAVYPSHYQHGYHITASTGVFGAAVAAGVLLNFNEEKMAMAIGLAATQSFGLREMFGTMTKPFHPGKAAQNGLLAALLVEKGFTSSTQALEAKRGFLNVYSPSYKTENILKAWGEVWEIEKNTFKPYACGIVLHPAIDACINLRQYAQPEAVQEIKLNVNPYVLELTGKENPTTGLEGKFSIYHTGAIAFLEGDASEDQYQDNKVNRPDVIAFREKIKPLADETVDKDKVVAILMKKDGTFHEIKVEHATGSIENPMSEAMLVKKFKNLCKHTLSEEVQDAVIKRMIDFEKLPSINQLIDLIQNTTVVR